MEKALDAKTQMSRLAFAIVEGDEAGVRRLLEDGCPISDRNSDPLLAAFRTGNEAIISALLQAGADLTKTSYKVGISWVIHLGHLSTIERAIERGVIPASEFDNIFFDAACNGAEAVALRMLDLGANPLHGDFVSRETWRDAYQGAARRGADGLASAILTRFTQKQKDFALQQDVRNGEAECVRLLLAAGADAMQRIAGRTLLQLAPRNALQVKRMLRSARTEESIESAMDGDDAAAPAAAASFTL